MASPWVMRTLRFLGRDVGVSAVAILSIAVGIAANTTIFSLVQAIEFPRLPYPQADRIVLVEARNTARDLSEMPASARDAEDVAASTRTLESVTLAADDSTVMREAPVLTRAQGRQVGPAFFSLLGVDAARGRVLGAGDTGDAVVLSDALWRRDFGANPAVVGQVIHLDDRAMTVAGVMPDRFDRDAEYWIPLAASAASAPRDDRRYSVFARLRTGASVADAERELAVIGERLATEYPATNANWTLFPLPLRRMHGQDARGVFFLLQGAVAFVLLIVCANIANILLARGTRRAAEMAIRIALGASRGQLVRQLLVESLVLSAIGGALGVGLAVWGIRATVATGDIPDFIEPSINGLVLAFAAGASMLTGVLCGILPAFRAASVVPDAALRADGGRSATGGRAGSRGRAVLVAVQVASAVVLTTGAALMLQTVANRQRVDLGFTPEHSLRGEMSLPSARYADRAVQRTTVAAALARVTADPSVAAAGVSAFPLNNRTGGQLHLGVPGRGDNPLGQGVRLGIESASPGFFAAMGIALKDGRVFTDADREGVPAVAIVNDELAMHVWPGASPLGQPLRLVAADGAESNVTVVGVVSTIRRSAMHGFVIARVYVPYAQFPSASVTTFVRARAESPAGLDAAALALRAAVRAVDPALVVDQLKSQEADLSAFVQPVRLIASLFGVFGLVGLFLAALGVFGMMSYAVSQRTREIAVRTALGARRADIIRLIVGNGLAVTALGLVPGVLLAIATARTLASFLFGVTPSDPRTLAGVTAVLVLTSLVACYRPARAAASVDPMSVLRRS